MNTYGTAVQEFRPQKACKFGTCGEPATTNVQGFPSCQLHYDFCEWIVMNPQEWQQMLDELIAAAQGLNQPEEVSAQPPPSEAKAGEPKRRRKKSESVDSTD